MMLVVDVVKGVQTQTAECLLIGELTCSRMVVVLNKTDLLPADKRQAAVEKMTKRLHKTLESTRCVFNTSHRLSCEMCLAGESAFQPVVKLFQDIHSFICTSSHSHSFHRLARF